MKKVDLGLERCLIGQDMKKWLEWDDTRKNEGDEGETELETRLTVRLIGNPSRVEVSMKWRV